MKKTLTLILAAGLLFVFGCAVPEVVDVDIKGNKGVGLRTGQTVNLHFDANPTTGYIWIISEKKGYDALKRMGQYKYTPESDRIGAGGTQTYTFEAVKKGRAELVFQYARPWETGKAPEKEYTVTIIVR